MITSCRLYLTHAATACGCTCGSSYTTVHQIWGFPVAFASFCICMCLHVDVCVSVYWNDLQGFGQNFKTATSWGSVTDFNKVSDHTAVRPKNKLLVNQEGESWQWWREVFLWVLSRPVVHNVNTVWIIWFQVLSKN